MPPCISQILMSVNKCNLIPIYLNPSYLQPPKRIAMHISLALSPQQKKREECNSHPSSTQQHPPHIIPESPLEHLHIN